MYGNLFKMKISIVTAYHNRRSQFINTLNSITLEKYNSDLEIVVVDDNSDDDNKIDDINELFPSLDIKLIEIKPEEKWWINPCVPFNIGFKESTGDVIIIQNPECLHMGEIIQATEKLIEDNKYLVFGCYSISPQETNSINNLEFDNNYRENISNIISPLKNRKAFDGKNSAWYQHSRYRPELLHFCSAMTRKDLLDDLGGFDERFAKGIAKDDREFVLRVRRKRMKIVQVDNPFVLHQQHNPTTYRPDLTQINNMMFSKIRNENTIKANT